MKYLAVTLTAILAVGSTMFSADVNGPDSVDRTDRTNEFLVQGFQWRLVAETTQSLMDSGSRSVPVVRLYRMLEAARISVEALPKFGNGSFYEKMIHRFCIASQESSFRKSYVNWNIPGYTHNVSASAPFSFDLGFIGLNARYHVPDIYHQAKELQDQGVIPKTIHLKHLDPTWHDQMERQYKKYLKHKVRPSRMVFSIPYEENNQDDYTSMMIYRILVEQDRERKGLIAAYDVALYDRLVVVLHRYEAEKLIPKRRATK